MIVVSLHPFLVLQADGGAKAESLKLAYVCKYCGKKWLSGNA
jgi:hypothetical protein